MIDLKEAQSVPTRLLGGTGLEITRIGCGGWQLGGGEMLGRRPARDDARRFGVVNAALDAGVNWIDTAGVYGLGHSESIVGQVLRDRGPRPFIFSKGGYEWDEVGRITQSLNPASLRRGPEASLLRLGVEALDLYQLHWPLPDEEVEIGWRTMLAFKEEGLVRHVGVSNFSVEQIRRCEAIGPVECCQCRYSLSQPEAALDLLPYCAEHGIGVIVYSPQGAGLLAGTVTKETVAAFASEDDRRDDPVFKEPALTRSVKLFEDLSAISEVTNLRPGALAIAWTLANPAVTGAIVGFDDPGQVQDAVRAATEERVFRGALRDAGFL